MRNTTRRVVGVGAAATCALASIGIGQALAAADPPLAPVFTKITVDPALTGASFVETADVVGDVRPELVASSFGAVTGPPPAGIPRAGTVQLYVNADKNKQGGAVDSWTRTTIASTTEGIPWPNDPTLSDVDGDGDIDVIVPNGYFFASFLRAFGSAFPGGGITWWEQQANGATWIRHDIVSGDFTGPPTAPPTAPQPPLTTTARSFSYHGVQHVDLDGDGIKDLVTVGEDGGNPSSGADDIVELQFLQGLGGGNFAAPVRLGGGGGSLPYVSDVDGDGRLDVVSAQFFGPVGGQPFGAPTVDKSSFVWFDQGDDGVAGLSQADFIKRKISASEGPSFQIKPVPNFRGDGVTRWIGTNHTNKNIPFPPFVLYPEPAVYELTPGADPTLPWTVVKLTAPEAFAVTGGVGQAAPGGVGAGDLDGDGDIDLAVSGDGDRRVYWLEQKGDGTFALNQMPGSNGYGQAGGNIVADLNRDGINEAVWGSFDANQVSIWQR